VTKDAAYWLRKEAEYCARAKKAETRARRLWSMADAAWSRAQPPREPAPPLLPAAQFSAAVMKTFGHATIFEGIVNKDYEA
jgi:hypothetical protein